MIAYLDDVNDRLKNRKYIYHYTSYKNCVNIVNSQVWFLSGAICMNDRLEYQNGDEAVWNDLFFASFMSDTDESIGMWSMYSQPWEEGVQIAIPVKTAKQWISGVKSIYEISCSSNNKTGRQITCSDKDRVFLSSVVYTNCDNNPNSVERNTWSNAENTEIKNASHIPGLTGYVKDSAWDYEKEVRIKARFRNTDNFGRVAIEIPDYVFDAMVFTSSPCFNGDLQARLLAETGRTLLVDRSIFSDKLILQKQCDVCPKKTEKKTTI